MLESWPDWLSLTSSMGRIAQDVIVKLLSDHRAISHVEAYSEWDSVCQKPVGSAPHEPCERVAACIAQWNRLPLAKLADSIKQFEWCNKLGHITPSTFCRFLFTARSIKTPQNGFLSWVAWMITICKDGKQIPVPIPLVPPKNRPRTLWKRDGATCSTKSSLYHRAKWWIFLQATFDDTRGYMTFNRQA